jgi:tol-pal system protein YbgF
MDRTERKLDETVQETRILRTQQNALADEVAQIRRLLESEGLVDDENRAELLTRLRDLERAVATLNARNQEQEDLLRRVSASLDQLTRQARPFETVPPSTSADSAPPQTTAPPVQAPAATPSTPPPAQASAADTTEAVPDSGVAAVDSTAIAAVDSTESPAAPDTAQALTSAAPGSTSVDTMAVAAQDTMVFDDAGGSPEMVVYDAARGDFARGNYGLAEQGFLELLRRFPGSQLADNAGYWLGESLYAEGEFDDALARFQDVLTRYPNGDALPAAQLKVGYCQLELGNTEAAIAAFKRVTLHYPESDEAANAQHRLTAMGNRP